MSSPVKRSLDLDKEQEKSPKKAKSMGDGPDNKQNSEVFESTSAFANFTVDEILNENSQNKLAFARGHFEGREEDAVISLEKTPFSKESVELILSSASDTKCTFINDIYGKLQLYPPKELSAIKISTVYPATEKHISKYRDQEVFLIHETEEDYKSITLPYLESETFSIQWVYNILEKKKESDRIVFEDPNPDTGFILLPDLKWDRNQMEDLYLVAVVHKHGIRSIRELNSQHLPLLTNILDSGRKAIEESFGVPSSKLRIYLHYQPSYYHLHVHFTHLKFQAPGSGVERAHFLTDVIENIQNDGEYYTKKTLPFTVREEDKLYTKFKKAGKI